MTSAHPDVLALRVADNILGGSSASRLFRVVREQHSLAYSVGTSVDGSLGALMAVAGTAPDDVEKASKLIRREVERLQEEGPSGEEIERAKSELGEELRSALDVPGAGFALELVHAACGVRRSVAEELEMLARVTARDAHRTLRKLKPFFEYRLLPKS